MNHPFYSLDEVADDLGYKINDLLKLGAEGKIEICINYNDMDYWSEFLDPLSQINEFIPISKADIMDAYQENKINSEPEKRQLTLKYKNHPPMLITTSGKPFSLSTKRLYILEETYNNLRNNSQTKTTTSNSKPSARQIKTRPDSTLTKATKHLFYHLLENGEKDSLNKANITVFAKKMKTFINKQTDNCDPKDLETMKRLQELIKTVKIAGGSITITTQEVHHPRSGNSYKKEKSNTYNKQALEKRLKRLREENSIQD